MGATVQSELTMASGQIVEDEIEIALTGLYHSRTIVAAAETLHQEHGFAITILTFEASAAESSDEEDVEDSFDRFTQF